MVGWCYGGFMIYLFEGSVFMGGVVVQWLCDGFGLIVCVVEIEVLVVLVLDSGGVYLVLVYIGFGVFYWDLYVCGVLFGLICGSGCVYIVWVVLEVIVFQSVEVLIVMEQDVGYLLVELWVDGGVLVNNLLLQFQVDLFGVFVICLKIIEMMVFGVVYLVGLVVGFWQDEVELSVLWQVDCSFELGCLVEWWVCVLVGWWWVVQCLLNWVEVDL